MFVREHQNQFRIANADVKIIYGNRMADTVGTFYWNKPPGVSHVYMLLIGQGADGNGSTGGGSGAVTVWYGAAQHVPDSLNIAFSVAGSGTRILYRTTSSTLATLLQANGGSGGTAGAATAANAFAASGFYQSTAGQAGSAGGVAAPTDTFLTGGGSDQGRVISNYGYNNTVGGAVGVSAPGFFQLQPIIVGVGGAGSTTNAAGGIGCGGGLQSGRGGTGMVLIASW